MTRWATMRFPRGMIQLHLAHTRGDDKVSEQYFFHNYNSIYLLSHAAPAKYSPCNLIKWKQWLHLCCKHLLTSSIQNFANAACNRSSVLLMSWNILPFSANFSLKKERRQVTGCSIWDVHQCAKRQSCHYGYNWSLYNDFMTTIPCMSEKESACTSNWHELVWSFLKCQNTLPHSKSARSQLNVSVFTEKFLHMCHISECLGGRWTSWTWSLLNRCNTTFKFWKPIQHWSCAHCFLCKKNILTSWEASVAVFPNLKHNLKNVHCFFIKVCPFLRRQKG